MLTTFQGGEIIVKVDDPAIFAGYWKNQEATDKRFARDVFKKGDLYYKSGGKSLLLLPSLPRIQSLTPTINRRTPPRR